MNCLSDEVLDSEFGKESKVWVVLDKNDPERFLLFPINENTLGLWAFMKKEDAEHFVRTLRELAPEYKNIELGIAYDPLNQIRNDAKENNCPLCVFSPNDSKEFFDSYPETLRKYYGLE